MLCPAVVSVDYSFKSVHHCTYIDLQTAVSKIQRRLVAHRGVIITCNVYYGYKLNSRLTSIRSTCQYKVIHAAITNKQFDPNTYTYAFMFLLYDSVNVQNITVSK